MFGSTSRTRSGSPPAWTRTAGRCGPGRALGFGFVEVGTVTRHPQPGNDRPRLFRLPAAEAMVNRMGFNNAGAAALAAPAGGTRAAAGAAGHQPRQVQGHAADRRPSRTTWRCRRLYAYGAYFAVNVSSPNTPGLRDLQDRAHLSALLGALAAQTRPRRPVLVKIAPDLTEPRSASCSRCASPTASPG